MIYPSEILEHKILVESVKLQVYLKPLDPESSLEPTSLTADSKNQVLFMLHFYLLFHIPIDALSKLKTLMSYSILTHTHY